jgi:centromere protein C
MSASLGGMSHKRTGDAHRLIVSRRTGVTLDQRPLDHNGIEEISGIFSSPRKPSPLKNVMVLEDSDKAGTLSLIFSLSVARMLWRMKTNKTVESSFTPPTSLSTRKSNRGTPARLPRSASPRKSGISGTARKSNGVDVFSPQKADQLEDDGQENTPVPRPASEELTVRKTRTSPRTARKTAASAARKTPARRFSPTPDNSPLQNALTITPSRIHKPRSSLELQRIEDEVHPSVEDEDFDLSQQAINEVEASATKPSGFTPVNQPRNSVYPPLESPQVPRIYEDPVLDFDDEDANEDNLPESSLPHVEQNLANSRKKRKSDVREESHLEESPRPAKVPKRRGRPPIHRDDDSPAPAPRPTTKAKGKQPLRNKDSNVKLSSRQARELDDIVEKVRSKPGPPRSLYILRRETPADDSVTHTRSGRISVKPLAYWRNERCVYADSPGGGGLKDGARFPMNSIKEIVRTEEVVGGSSKSKRGRKAKTGKKGSSKGKARPPSAQDVDSSDESDFSLDGIPQDLDAEEWETDTGTLKGLVSIWDNEGQAPTEEEAEIEIAHAPAAIKTREVKNTGVNDGPTFRYAKLLSTKFFGTGLVDLPPGGIKRPKNSRKMHMSFFVVKGRVTVCVGPLGGEETGSWSRFSIGKGGFWQVPRGEYFCGFLRAGLAC